MRSESLSMTGAVAWRPTPLRRPPKIHPALALLGAGLLLAGTVARAGDIPDHYALTVVADREHGARVLDGDYDRAIRALGSGLKRFPFAHATNLCVALAMSGERERAEEACGVALLRGEQAARSARGPNRAERYREWAIALSNHGVLQALAGNPEGAREDFRVAVEVGADTGIPARNLARLESGATDEVAAR